MINYVLQVSFSFCWWQRGRKVMTCIILIAWLIWIAKACVIWMSYMPCKILENITRLIDHIESMPYIDIMKFMLKIFISYRSKNCPISFDLWFSSKFRIYYCLMRITISSTVRTYWFMLEFNGMEFKCFYLIIIWHIDRGSYV